jgi:type II secretory pathway pseudopilin PulG
VRRPSRRDGLTLVETVIATGVLAVLLLGTYSTLGVSQKTTVLTRERNAATEVAFRQLDDLMSLNFDEVAVISHREFTAQYDTGQVDGAGVAQSAPLRVASPYPFTRPTGANAAFPGQITVVQDPPIDRTNPGAGTCGPDVLELRVTVAWRCADGTNTRVDAVTRRVRGSP